MADPSDQRVASDAPEEPPVGTFEEIYDAFAVPVYRYVYARVGNRPDAEDLTAQVFTRAVEQLDTSRDRGQIASWLFRVAQHAIADYWRAFYRLPVVAGEQVAPGWEPVDQAGSSTASAGDDLASQRVEALLRRLPANYRRVLELRFLQRLSVAETAERMGVSRANAKVLQYRALRRAAALGEAGDG